MSSSSARLRCFCGPAQVEQKIVDELRAHGLLATREQPQPRAPDYADLDKLIYLSCVIKEAMRTHTVRTLTVNHSNLCTATGHVFVCSTPRHNVCLDTSV